VVTDKHTQKHDDKNNEITLINSGDSFNNHAAAQFNLAEIGAVSNDMKYMVSVK
jgi:hypothetical protein